MGKIFEAKVVATETGTTINLADVVKIIGTAENISDRGYCANGERWQEEVQLADGTHWLLIWEFPEDVIPVDENGERSEHDDLLPWDDVDYIVRAVER